MLNPYKQVKEIVRKYELDNEDLVHALLSSMFTNCCDDCSHHMKSDEFMQAFDRMAQQMRLCKDLSGKLVA